MVKDKDINTEDFLNSRFKYIFN